MKMVTSHHADMQVVVGRRPVPAVWVAVGGGSINAGRGASPSVRRKPACGRVAVHTCMYVSACACSAGKSVAAVSRAVDQPECGPPAREMQPDVDEPRGEVEVVEVFEMEVAGVAWR